jgi:hypothetical protein
MFRDTYSARHGAVATADPSLAGVSTYRIERKPMAGGQRLVSRRAGSAPCGCVAMFMVQAEHRSAGTPSTSAAAWRTGQE